MGFPGGSRSVAGALTLIVGAAMLAGCSHLGSGTSLRQECAQLADAGRAGDYKSAVDGWRALRADGYACPDKVTRAVETSRSKLEAADALVRRSMKLKHEGDLAGARDTLRRSLEIYPRYFWVRKLLSGVEAAIDAEVAHLMDEAHYLESVGDLDAGLVLLQKAGRLRPDDPAIRVLAARLEESIAMRARRTRASEALALARTLTDQGRYKRARRVLQDAEAERYLGQVARDMLDTVNGLINAEVLNLYSRAQAAWKQGDLDTAAVMTSSAIVLEPAGETLARDTVELARLLGIKLYSSGQFTSARRLWEKALVLDPGNREIRDYLVKVKERLADLDRIREEGDR